MLPRLNRQQQKAVQSINQHTLVLAGAGTGKTMVIIAHAEHLINNGVNPRRILLLTFTRRAAQEMVYRLETTNISSSKGIIAGTFHHFCLIAMRRMPRKFGIEGYTVIDRDDQIQLMRMARSNFVEKGKKFLKAPTLVKILSYARNTNKPIRDYLEKYKVDLELNEKGIEKTLKVFSKYSERKRNLKYLDFDDILYLFAKGLHRNKEIHSRMKSLFDHILVDEMQDTNPLQWLILDGLRDPAKLFCVGDDAQSIYAFRGADFQNVHSFTTRIPKSAVKQLDKNYRSTQEVLDVANWLIGNSPLSYKRNLTADRGKGIIPRLLDFDSEYEEAEWLAEDLIDRHETGSDWKNHMILTRTQYGARTIEAELLKKKIPYRFIGGTSLLRAAHVKDVLSMVRVVVNHHDELAWMRYLTMWYRIGDVTAAKFVAIAHKCSSWKKVEKELSRFFTDRNEVIDGLKEVYKNIKHPKLAIDTAAKYLEPLQKIKYERWGMRKRDLPILSSLAENHNTVIEFIETYALNPIHNTEIRGTTTDQEQDCVTLITVHSAKGTEAPVCYVVKVQPAMYPHFRSLGDRDAEEEERRILYVAITRAMNELIMTRSSTSGRVFHDGSVSYSSYGSSKSSYLLEDFPKALADHEIHGFDDFDEIITPYDDDE